MTGQVLRLGRLPNDPAKPRLRLRLAPGAARAVPSTADWMSRVTDWPMYANDRYGDCVWAMIAHTIQSLSTYGQGSTATVTDGDVLQGYADVTGFDRTDPSTDRGTVIQDALNYWRKVGVGGHRILAFAQVDHTDHSQVAEAVAQFGHILLGIDFPASAMDQFNAGQPWDVIRGDGGIEGGHAIPGGAYGAPDGRARIVTWARAVEMTAAFAERYVEEAWVVVAPEWLSAAGTDPLGVDLPGLGAQFSALTGEPSPFGPPPTPGPPPFSRGCLGRFLPWSSRGRRDGT